MARLCLNLTFDEAFVSYKESWIKNCLFFEGVMREDFADTSDLRIVDFVSGGRRYKAYKLERRGASCKGWVRYYPYVPMMATKDIKADKELVRKIRLVVDKGVSIADTAYYFNVPYDTIVRIKRRKGAFKGV